MNWVRNVSVTTCAAPASAASTSPRWTRETESTLPPSWSAGAPSASAAKRARDRVEHLVLDLDERGRRTGGVTGLRGDGREHVADVRRRLALGDELAPVARDRALHALAGNVRGRDDCDDAGMRERLRGVDPEDPGPRVVREAERAVEHPRVDHVADERLVAERQLACPGSGRCGSRRGRCGRAREAARRGRRGGGELDRVDHLHVAGAAAEVAEQRVRDLVPRRLRMLVQQRLGLHHDAGRAEAALRRPCGHEALAPAPTLLLGEALVGDDVLALEPARLLRAGDDCASVDQHRARTAGALGRAAVLDRPHTEVVAEQLEQARALARLRDTGFPLSVNSRPRLLRYSIAPSTSEMSAIRMTTPLNASDQYRACRVPSTSSGSSSMRGRLWRTIDPGFALSRSSSRVTR